MLPFLISWIQLFSPYLQNRSSNCALRLMPPPTNARPLKQLPPVQHSFFLLIIHPPLSQVKSTRHNFLRKSSPLLRDTMKDMICMLLPRRLEDDGNIQVEKTLHRGLIPVRREGTVEPEKKNHELLRWGFVLAKDLPQ